MSAGLYVKLLHLSLSLKGKKKVCKPHAIQQCLHKYDMQIIIVSLETHLALQSALLAANDPSFHNKAAR